MRAWMLGTWCMAVALAGCVSLRDAPRHPPGDVVRRDRLIIDSSSPLGRQQEVIDNLAALRQEVATRLQLPDSTAPVYVHLFDTPAQLDGVVRQMHPDLLDRRAFFVAEGGRLQVYASRGDHLAEDLRHEVTHAYLHAAVPHLPLWLDEGLAEYFEVPPTARGVNWPHVALLRERRRDRQWAPDLARLERLSGSHEMTQQDYAESWAWVQFLLDTAPARREWLIQHLAQLQRGEQEPRLSGVLATAEPQAAAALVAHLQQL